MYDLECSTTLICDAGAGAGGSVSTTAAVEKDLAVTIAATGSILPAPVGVDGKSEEQEMASPAQILPSSCDHRSALPDAPSSPGPANRFFLISSAAEFDAQRAFTLIEILLAIAIIAVLAAIAIPNYSRYVEKAKVAVAVTDIAAMSAHVAKYMDDNNYIPPDNLAALGMSDRLDPWGRLYVFTNLRGVRGNGSARKDKNLNPLNSDFDLYSLGRDGQSMLPLSPKVSQDDVIRARDGRFIGLAKDFDP